VHEQPLVTLTVQFLKERTYLNNVTPATLVWYRVHSRAIAVAERVDDPSFPAGSWPCGVVMSIAAGS